MSVEEFNQIPHFLFDYIKKYAAESPDAIAMIDADTGKFYSWKYFETVVNMLALKLLEDGWQKGEYHYFHYALIA